MKMELFAECLPWQRRFWTKIKFRVHCSDTAPLRHTYLSRWEE